VLTPHAKEYERLVGEPVGADRLAAAARLADAAGAVALLKGPGTVVAAPGGAPVAINPTGGPALASAGTGDVLSGIVGALVARGGEPWWAAAAAAFVHGRAAEAAGHTGLVAGDLIDALPRVLDELEP
jgi:NAD(P)H-hydrate epimerase